METLKYQEKWKVLATWNSWFQASLPFFVSDNLAGAKPKTAPSQDSLPLFNPALPAAPAPGQLGTELLPSGHPQQSPLLQLWVGARCMRCPHGHSVGQGCLKKPRPRPQQGNSGSWGRPSKVTLVCVQGSPHLQEDPPGATLICLKIPPASSHPTLYEPRVLQHWADREQPLSEVRLLQPQF